MAKAETSKVKVYITCCTRLSGLVDSLKKVDMDKEELLIALEDIAGTMEKLANDPNFLNDEDEVTEIDDMPPEIKDWLASTFTGIAAPKKRTERPRFKAVVNAILAMLMVEKIFKKSTESAAMNIPPAIAKLMENSIHEWDFDILSLDKKCNGHTLKYMTVYIFLHHNILRKYKVSSDFLEEFLNNIEIGYNQNSHPYYNSVHASDVLQTVHFFIQNYKMMHWITDLQVFVFLFSAVIHDYDDPGYSNAFLIKTNDQLGLIYNDSQIRENHHVSAVFKILQNPKCNFIRALNKNEYSEFRKSVIECVLSCDHSQHFYHLKTIKAEMASGNEVDKMKTIQFMLHAADISHPSKIWSIHNKWVEMWQEQMFRQGDREKELNIPFSPICSRKTAFVPEIQSSFLTYIIEPTFQLLGRLLELVRPPLPFAKTPGDMTIMPALTHTHSGTNTTNKSYPWNNRIVLNKSMWLRMAMARFKLLLHNIITQ